METTGNPALPAVGCTVPVWLPRDIRAVFERHVGKDQGKRGRYGKDAIVAALKRDGAFAAKHDEKAAEVLKSVPADALPLLLELAELISVRGLEAARDMLDGLKQQTLETEAARR